MSRYILAISVAVSLGLATGHTQTLPVTENEPVLLNSSLQYLEQQLVTSKRPDGADMDELSARLSWVLRGNMLPDEARLRTILRANSPKPDYIGPWGFRQDTAPSKRALSMAIIGLDDALRAKIQKPDAP